MKKLYALLIAIGISSVIFAAATNAQVVFSDSFTYPDGPLVGAGGSPWVTNSGIAGQINVVSGEAYLSDADTEDATATFSTPATSDILRATFNFRNDTDVSTSAAGDYITNFVTTGGNTFFARVFLISSPGGAADDFSIGISTTSATPTATFGTLFTAGVNLSLTLDYNFTTDVASLTIAGFGTITATDVVNTASLDRFQLREGGTSHGDQFIDNLVVSIVPEPSTWAMIAIGAGLLTGVQRFRRKRS